MRARLRPVTVATLIVIAIAACGGDGSDDTSRDRAPTPTGAEADDPVLVHGRDVFVTTCAGCHGTQGQGGNGPRLAGRVERVYPEVGDQERIVRDGRGSMPSFAGELSDADIEAVVRYEREVL